MADKKLSELTALPEVANGDLLYTLDVSDATDFAEGSSRKATVSQLSAKVRGDIVEGDIPAAIARDSEVTAAIDALDAAVAAALALKASLASPALTGTPTAPTPAEGTNTTQIATTAFVLANAGYRSPDAFTFTTTNDATPSTLTISNTVTLAGGSTVNDTWIVTVSAASGSPQARVNGGAWSNTRGEMALTCRSGDTLQLRVTAAGALGQVVIQVRVGGRESTWTVNSAAWAPSLLSGLVFWYAADPTKCFQDAGAAVPCGDGDPIYTWLDSSSGERTLTQSTLGSRPKLRFGSRWYFETDGVDDRIDWVGGTAFDISGIWFAGQLHGSVGNNGMSVALVSGSPYRCGPVWFPNNTTLYTGDTADLLHAFTNRVNGSASNTSPGQGVSGVFGQQKNSGVASNISEFRLGYSHHPVPLYIPIRISELIGVSSITNDELALLESYLASRLP